jgi:hypothetical protein
LFRINPLQQSLHRHPPLAGGDDAALLAGGNEKIEGYVARARGFSCQRVALLAEAALSFSIVQWQGQSASVR